MAAQLGETTTEEGGMTLAEFLLARLEEDQVKRAVMREWHAEGCDHLPDPSSEYTYPCNCGVPERMAREVEAKRRIVELHTAADGDWHECRGRYGTAAFSDAEPCDTLRLLALPYADHPDYDRSWAV